MLVSDKKFNNIKIHTQYSICEGAIKIDELAEFCKKNKIKSLGLADNYNLCGALEFSEKLSKVGTQPIIGSQINIRDNNITGKVTLYAKTEDGFKNLTKLFSSPPIITLPVRWSILAVDITPVEPMFTAPSIKFSAVFADN